MSGDFQKALLEYGYDKLNFKDLSSSLSADTTFLGEMRNLGFDVGTVSGFGRTQTKLLDHNALLDALRDPHRGESVAQLIASSAASGNDAVKGSLDKLINDHATFGPKLQKTLEAAQANPAPRIQSAPQAPNPASLNGQPPAEPARPSGHAPEETPVKPVVSVPEETLSEGSGRTSLFKRPKSGDIDHEALGDKGGTERVFNKDHKAGKELRGLWDDIESRAKVIERKKGALESITDKREKKIAQREIDRLEKALKKQGAIFETKAHGLLGELKKEEGKIEGEFGKKIRESGSKTEINELRAEQERQLRAVRREQEHLSKYRTAAQEKAKHNIITGKADGVRESGKKLVGGKGSIAIENAANRARKHGIFTLSKEGKLFSDVAGGDGAKLETWGKGLGWVEKIKGRVGGQMHKATGIGQLIVGGGGLVYFGSGLLMDAGRLVGAVAPKKDAATGQDVPTEFSTVAIDAAGTAASVALAVGGGRGRAMGTEKFHF